jgi:beta-glucuronidase
MEPVVQKGFNRKGLFSDQGKRKKAFYVMKKWYEKKTLQY